MGTLNYSPDRQKATEGQSFYMKSGSIMRERVGPKCRNTREADRIQQLRTSFIRQKLTDTENHEKKKQKIVKKMKTQSSNKRAKRKVQIKENTRNMKRAL